jgi:Stress up-regulated Nod 19
MPLDGYIIGSTGHVHDGGTNILLTLNNKTICDSKATYGGDDVTLKSGKHWETILSMSDCSEPVKVKAGDYISTTAIYDTTKHALYDTLSESQY